MIIIDGIDQASADWFRLKLGVISASRASEFSIESKLAPMPDVNYSKEGKYHVFWHDYTEYRGTNKTEVQNEIRSILPPVYGDMRQGYMCELVAQVATDTLPDMFTSKQCQWGNDHEDQARAYLELELGIDVTVPTFIYRDKNKRFGISPDGLVVGKEVGVELKCPFTSKVHIEFITCDKIKKEYIEQTQFSMWVTGYKQWYFASYDPRMKTKKLHWVLLDRDDAYMAKFDKAEKPFIDDMNKMLAKVNVDFGEQWN